MNMELKTLMREWLDILARGETHRWHEVADEEMVLRLPFAPTGLPGEMRGRDTCSAAAGELWKSFKSFDWTEATIHATDDPNLLITLARSRAETLWGAIYANQYCITTRFRNGKVVEQNEYMNPLVFMDVFAEHLPGA